MTSHTSFSREPLSIILGCLFLASLASTQITDKTPKPRVDLVVASSVATNSFKIPQALPTGTARYGYPYLVAPTLSPAISARSDDFDGEMERSSRVKPFGSKLSASDETAKKSTPKKYKPPSIYGSSRRHGLELEGGSPVLKRLKSFLKEPKYRNLEELESSFRPRRMDLDGHYSPYDYPPSGGPPVSPKDPYLSPNEETGDGFYPMTKVKSYQSPYPQSNPIYGAGKYDPYYDDHSHGGYDKDPYEGPTKYSSGSQGHYHDYQEDYAIESNKPITGDVRKRLLDYAGASDLYEGEPDYLQEVALNKNKYGHVANDYYAYGGPDYRSSYRDYPYVESKVRIFKKTLK